MDNLNTLNKESQLPLEITLSDLSPNAFIDYFHKNSVEIEGQLETKGAVKFKGIQIDSQDTFQLIVDSISSKFLSYIDGNSPRTKLSGNVYTSTEYDQSQKITLHNELSYSAIWPNKLFFSCIQPSTTGGETLIADSRKILKAMNDDIVNQIRERGVTYIRNLHGGMGMGPSWQDTFETTSKGELEELCRSYNINLEWSDNNNLKLIQKSDGIIKHRKSGEELWFNQIDQFHPCHLGDDMLETMEIMYDSPENYPMYVSFGNGEEIDKSTVQEILKTIEEVTIAPKWDNNELLILDNELVSHGRNPYTGDRRVLVAMSE